MDRSHWTEATSLAHAPLTFLFVVFLPGELINFSRFRVVVIIGGVGLVNHNRLLNYKQLVQISLRFMDELRPAYKYRARVCVHHRQCLPLCQCWRTGWRTDWVRNPFCPSM